MKFIIVTVFPGKRRSAIRIDQVLSIHDDPEGTKLYTTGDAGLSLTLFCRESFDNVMEQLRNVD